LELLDKVKAAPIFETHMGTSGKNGTKSKSIELLVLGSLRYLGRGWMFDDLEENTGIGEETFRRFFHKFIQFGSTVLYNEFVITPCDSNQHTATHQHEFNKAGCHGAIGSTDAVHVTLEKVQRTVRNSHLGWKLAHTARTYNVTVNHRRNEEKDMVARTARRCSYCSSDKQTELIKWICLLLLLFCCRSASGIVIS
jgi:hypothetical protein